MKILRQLNELKKYSSKIDLASEKHKQPWKILITTILSARTKDETTIPVSIKLFSKYNALEKLSKANLKDIQEIIYPVNYYKNKSKYILKTSKLLVNKKIPLKLEKLIQLPGVGRKTANVFLLELGKNTIPVDTHLAYISQKLNWTKNKKPENIEEDLKKLFPKKYWSKLNSTLVRFGKTYTSKKEKAKILGKIKKI